MKLLLKKITERGKKKKKKKKKREKKKLGTKYSCGNEIIPTEGKLFLLYKKEKKRKVK